MAEGAPLLREYAVYPVSRVRIPLSPPIKKDSLLVDIGKMGVEDRLKKYRQRVELQQAELTCVQSRAATVERV